MSQQLQITGGAKVRDLQDVIIGTSGVLSSLAFNVANGVPKLDVNGKILVSQLPNSVMEYQGTWNAATNTPTLVNGTGNQGDVYLCNVAGTTNFGAGPITFAVGDSAIYSGTIWQRAGGATGTVTSVGLTSTGNDAITITGSPITTSGNINLGFAGTNLQYINGAGDLTTFPTLISSIGLTMPSAFSVANSPLTANGTIAVTGAGYPSQYIRGDGTLADFPTSGGGGSSVSYYLNGGTSQGTIGGVTYYEMSKTADTGTGVDFNKTGDGFIVAFLTDAGDPAQLNIPAGNWNYEIYASMSANGGTPEMYAELYKYDGTTFTLISTSSNEILYDGTNLNLYTFAMTVPSTTLAITDRLAIKLYATNSGGKTTTVHTQDSHLCQIITTFSTGITALNGLTAQVQYFATGTSGTDFNISSATATHTFNLPVASAANTGKLSSTDWSTFNGKVPYTGAIANVDLGLFSLKANGILAYGNGTAGGIVSFTQTGTLAGVATGSASIGSVSAGKLNIYFGDAGLEAAILDNSLLTADRTYNFPNASGTLALLESTQTFSGVNTFSALTSFTFSSGTRMDYGPYLTKGSVPTVFSGTTTNIYSDATTNNIVIRDNSSIAKLEFNNSTQTFTFPSASGTIALTSDIPSLANYVTLNTIQTISANKTFSEFGFFDKGVLLKQNIYPSASGYNGIGAISGGFYFSLGQTTVQTLLFNTSTPYQYTFPNATGTLPLGTGTTNYHAKWTGTNTIGNSLIWDNGTNVGIGNTNTTYKLEVTGTLGVSGAATFISAAGITNGNGLNLRAGGNTASDANVLNFTSLAGTINVSMFSDASSSNTRLKSLGNLSFHTGNIAISADNERMTITSAGNVGIGTSSPLSKFAVKLSGATSPSTVANTTGFDNTYVTFGNDTVSGKQLGIGVSQTDQQGSYLISVAPSSEWIDLSLYARNNIFYGNGTERMRITSGGNVLIGTTSVPSAYGLVAIRGTNQGLTIQDAVSNGYRSLYYQSGNLYFYNGTNEGYLSSGGTWVNASDITLKKDVKEIEYGIDEVMKLKPKWYRMIEDDLEQIGFIAQDVEEVLPELVSTSERGMKGLSYGQLTAVLTKAIQEQQAQIQNLQEQINILAK